MERDAHLTAFISSLWPLKTLNRLLGRRCVARGALVLAAALMLSGLCPISLALAVEAAPEAQPVAADSSASSPDWAAQCELPARAGRKAQRFEVKFQSPSGDATEDDMQVVLVVGDRSVPLHIRPHLFWPKGLLSNVQGLCAVPLGAQWGNAMAKLSALDVGEGRILLLLEEDGRPSLNRLRLVLVDLKRMQVLDNQLMGEVKSVDPQGSWVVLKHGKGHKIRLVRRSLGLSDTLDDFIEGWRWVGVEPQGIRSRWLDRD